MKKNIFTLSFVIIAFCVPVITHAATTWGTNITTNTTWTTAGDGIYVVTNPITISATLTINPGVIVKFETTADGMTVNSGGSISAVGTGGSPIYLTSYHNDIGGNTDGASTAPVGGDWKEIKINSGGTANLKHVKIDYGGNSGGSGAMIWNNGGTVTLATTTATTSWNIALYNSSGNSSCSSDCKFNGSYTAIYLAGGNLDVAYSEFLGNTYFGVFGAGTGTLTLNYNTFANNIFYGAGRVWYGDGLTFNHVGNSASGVGLRGFRTDGPFNTSQTWTKDIPYIIYPYDYSYLSIDTGKTLTIDPGVVVKFGWTNEGSIIATGTINAMGSESDPIYFTSLKDDEVGGDTNFDTTSSAPLPGDWKRILIATSGAEGTFNNSVFRYGGFGSSTELHANITNLGGDLTISSSTIASSTLYGVLHWATGGNTEISSSTFTGNPYGLVSAQTTASDVTCNYWDDVSGPYHAQRNPSGTGDAIYDNSNTVQFKPWFGSADLQTCSPQGYFAEIKNTSVGSWRIRDDADTSADVLKELPEDWVVYVASTTDANGDPVSADGYYWYQVVDPTDDITGWMAGVTVSGMTEHLPYVEGSQTEFETVSSTLLTSSTTRSDVIYDAVEHYYANSNTAHSLYSSDDNSNDFSKIFNNGTSSLPQMLVYGMAAQETGCCGNDFDNEIVSFDYGHGIMQLTPYQVWANEPDDWANNTENVPSYGSHLAIPPCLMIASNEYVNCYTNAGTQSGSAKTYKEHNDYPGFTFKHYANTEQSIYANVKDGLKTLRTKYDVYGPPCNEGDLEFTAPGHSTTTFSCIDRSNILAVWGYNGFVESDYLLDVASRIEDITDYFSSVSPSATWVNKLEIGDYHKWDFQTYSPVELRVVDSRGRTTGLVDGKVVTEIPHSAYDAVTETGAIFFGEDSYTFRLIGTDNDTYGFRSRSKVNGKDVEFRVAAIPTHVGEIHEFVITPSKILDGTGGVRLKLDRNGDGSFEEEMTENPEFTVSITDVKTLDQLRGEEESAVSKSGSKESISPDGAAFVAQQDISLPTVPPLETTSDTGQGFKSSASQELKEQIPPPPLQNCDLKDWFTCDLSNLPVYRDMDRNELESMNLLVK